MVSVIATSMVSAIATDREGSRNSCETQSERFLDVPIDGWRKGRNKTNVRRVRICGESGDVSGGTVESWKERLPELMFGYNQADIRNMHETRCYWRAFPYKGFGMEGKQYKVGEEVQADTCN